VSSSSSSFVSSSPSSSTSGSSTSALPLTGEIWFASGPEWESFAPETPNALSSQPGASLGLARAVCVTAYLPPNCPDGALVYDGSPFTPWRGGESIAGAQWIWRGDVSASQPADLQAAVFVLTFTVGPQPSGSIQIAVDDLAEVFVNGVSAGTTGSIASSDLAAAAAETAVTIDLTPELHEGLNFIAVAAQNGPSSFGLDCAPQGCTYSQNPAGVVFAGTLSW
jgi:hypothetical protein